ncbi:hypothetical protein EYF80_038527 [Liparis tanakae]|uniref:Uncharacterized protein n=1 Tax=Liparis tanakae TaxID=230148 RepID=A0A4Z2GCG2_9TELE|nr:hypothetical protein EYF80_038527 [Liparis tanakae]
MGGEDTLREAEEVFLWLLITRQKTGEGSGAGGSERKEKKSRKTARIRVRRELADTQKTASEQQRIQQGGPMGGSRGKEERLIFDS